MSSEEERAADALVLFFPVTGGGDLILSILFFLLLYEAFGSFGPFLGRPRFLFFGNSSLDVSIVDTLSSSSVELRRSDMSSSGRITT